MDDDIPTTLGWVPWEFTLLCRHLPCFELNFRPSQRILYNVRFVNTKHHDMRGRKSHFPTHFSFSWLQWRSYTGHYLVKGPEAHYVLQGVVQRHLR